MRFGIAAALVVLMATPSLATKYVWVGGADNNWTTANNWSPSGTPGVGDSAYLTNRTDAYTVILNNNTIGGGFVVTNGGPGGVTNGLAGLVLSNAQNTVTLLVTNCMLVMTGAVPGAVFSSNSVLEVDNGGSFSNAMNVSGGTGVKIACTNFVLNLGGGGVYYLGTTGENALVPALSNSILTIQSSSNSMGGKFVLAGGSTYGAWWDVGDRVQYNETIVMSAVSNTISDNSSIGVGWGNAGARSSNLTLRVINNAVLTLSGNQSFTMNCASNNLFYIASGGTYNNAQSFTIGAGNYSVGNRVIVNNGNLIQAAALSVGGGGLTNCFNSLIVSNGGLVTATGGNVWHVPSYNATNGGNNILVTDPGSRLKLIAGCTFTLGCTVFNPGSLTALGASNGMTVVNSGVFSNLSANTTIMSGYLTYMNIASNGQVWNGSGGALGIGVTGLVAGVGDTGCGVNLTTGGLLDLGSSSLIVGHVYSANNYLTNNAGILQFSTATPTIALTNTAGGNNITIANGTISFRNVKNANVFMNNQMNQTNGVTYQGNNTFMLNASTNYPAAGSNQSYNFSTAYGAANWAGLAMVNGTATGPTMYTNGTVTIESTGWVTFSNAVAVIASNFFCSGTMNVADSTVTFKTNLTLNSGFAMNLTTNTVGNTVNVLGTLDLSQAANATINAAGALKGKPSTVTIFTCSGPGGILGTPAGWTVSPPSYRIIKSGNNIVLQQINQSATIIIYK